MTDEERQEHFKHFLRLRGVETPCPRCQGLGTKTYGSTSTWRGGMGGSTMTKDVCDECWGSGDMYQHGDNLREMRATENARIAERAATLLVDSVGANLSLAHPAIEAIVGELRRLANGRKQRPQFFYDLCQGLSKALQAGVDAYKARVK